ncbi:MAG: hypothetical protein K5848_07165 [Lachnospiraceae bacterium]|nr:hypothetical protein [Lachnospiraceae bacterium]
MKITKAVMYFMLLSDSIIAGYFIGQTGVAAINAITPVTGIVTFFGDLVSTGVGDLHIEGLSGYVISGLMEAHKEKTYLVTTGYNRNMIRFHNA